jgi:hypothetical protein
MVIQPKETQFGLASTTEVSLVLPPTRIRCPTVVFAKTTLSFSRPNSTPSASRPLLPGDDPGDLDDPDEDTHHSAPSPLRPTPFPLRATSPPSPSLLSRTLSPSMASLRLHPVVPTEVVLKIGIFLQISRGGGGGGTTEFNWWRWLAEIQSRW